jgi:intracellular multiplication protein IcmQ
LQSRIVTYRDALSQEIEAHESQAAQDTGSNKNTEVGLPDGQTAIFICLYKSFGDDIAQWEKTLASFSGHVLGRPIYATEEAAGKFISSKANREPEGYIELWIAKDMIIDMPPSRMLYDKFGSPLLTLKQGALSSNQIRYFTSGAGKRYRFTDNKLVFVAEKKL